MGDRWLGLPVTAVVTAVAMLAVAPDGWLANAVPLLLAGVGSALAFLRAGSVPPAQRPPWRLFGAGGLTSVVGGAAAVLVTPDTTAADVLELTDSVVLVWFILGTFWLVRLRAFGRHREVLLDGFVLSLPAVVVGWELGAQPALMADSSRLAATDALTMLALSIVMLWMAAALVRLGAGLPSAWLVALSAAAFGLYSVMDIAALGTPAGTPLRDLALLVNAGGGGLAVLAAVHPSARRLTEGGRPQRPSMTGRQLAMLAVSLAAPPLGLLVGPEAAGDRVFYGVTTLEVLVLAGPRAIDVLRERDAALRRRDAAQATLQVQATTDTATGLANRAVVQDRLEEVLRARRADGGRCAVLFMDLDDFKLVNDTFGHEAGDRVLAAVATRMDQARLAEELVARFGGDEFVVVLPQVATAEEAVRAAHRYLRAATGTERIAGQEFRVGASIGVVVSRGHSATYSSLIRDADTAMYDAKRHRSGVVVFDEALRIMALEQLRVEQGLRTALRTGDGLHLHVQPVVDLMSHATVCHEVRLRWDDADASHQTLALIDVAERSGLVHELGEWVIDRACAQWARWHDADGDSHPIAITASARELVRADYVPMVQAALERHGVPAHVLMIQLTERDVLHEIDAVSESMAGLRRTGVRIAVVDFGTGYFSFAQLRQVPVDVLKLDPRFVRDMLEDPAADAIVRACLDLGRAIDLGVIAAGVDQPEHADRLRALGCEWAQGAWMGDAADEDASISRSAPPPGHPGR